MGQWSATTGALLRRLYQLPPSFSLSALLRLSSLPRGSTFCFIGGCDGASRGAGGAWPVECCGSSGFAYVGLPCLYLLPLNPGPVLLLHGPVSRLFCCMTYAAPRVPPSMPMPISMITRTVELLASL
ncbi:hypothetical protein MUK42_14039 [Musa troglodytarum]|uniref:Uncharacterized protein n=1 Tax=Musa troglodytarum TaxID=320322 RepID=A0A9E7KE99_9LILI|nr:hypothetical protein MUK42_14039 [Musa troglodytarum]